MIRKLAWIPLALLLLVWAGSGLMMVDTGEKALVYRFGAVSRVAGAGLHLHLPWPIERDERLNVTEVRRVEPPARRLLTADTNLVQLSVVVQYTVSDPVAWTLASRNPEAVVSDMVQAAAVAGAASMDVDTLLTTGRAELERQLLEASQRAVDEQGLGLRLVAVDVRELVPPGPVVDAFNDVSSARGDRETLALSAEAYTSKLLPDVRGQAAEAGEHARANAARRLAGTRADTARFDQLLGAFRADREGTRIDLHAATVQAVSPRLEILVAPPGAEINLPTEGKQP